jgi:putative ABC transport system permease protein
VSSTVQSIRQAVRRLARARGFSIAAILTLTLGIGATTAVFSVVNAVLLRPLPYASPEQLVDLSHTLSVSGVSRVDQSDATYLFYRRANRVFADIGVYRSVGVTVGRLGGAVSGGDSRSERVSAARVSASTLSVLGAAPLHGRTFRENEDRPDAPPVVLLAERLWERKYGGDESIVGRQLEIDGIQREVVGILPAGFDLPSTRTDVWLPIGIDPAKTASAAFDYRGVGRLRDGATIAAATADLQSLLPRMPEAFPGRLTTAAIEQTQMRSVVRPLRDVVVGDVGRVLWVVLGAAAFVLLIACANVMNLFLVRAEGRYHELAVRRALGAGGSALVREHVLEGALLAVIGGVLALGVSIAGVRALRSLEGTIAIPRMAEVRIDGAVLGVALGVTLMAVLLVSIIPAFRAVRTAATAVLSGMGRSVTAGRTRHRARNALVVAQLALALVLLVGAGLMARSFARLREVPSGVDAAHAFVFRVALPPAAYSDVGATTRYIARAIDAVRMVPGVQSAAVISKLPLLPDARQDSALFLEDRPLTPGTMPNVHQVAFTSPGYFAAMGIRVMEGRTFDEPDLARIRHEVIVSRSLAARYWPRERAVGKRVRTAPVGAWYTIIGVVDDVRGTALDQPPDEIIYLPVIVALGPRATDVVPQRPWAPRDIAFVARSDGDPSLIASQVESAVRALDPAVPAFGGRLMADVVAGAAARTTLTLMLLGIASAVALALGAVGIYGVVSYVVSLRSREIAVRLALGARPVDVQRMISLQAATLVTVGIVIGLVAAVAMTRVLAALLFGVDPIDPATMAGAALLLALIGVIASWIPAYRASGIDPAQALRTE